MHKPCKLSDIPPKHGSRTDVAVRNDIEDFMKISSIATEIRVPEKSKAKYEYQKYHNAVRKQNLPIDVTVRGGRLFLIKRAAARSTSPNDSRG